MEQLEVERQEYIKEMEKRKEMEEEQRLIAQQEAIEKALSQPKPAEELERPMPVELSESLQTVAEGNEEEKGPEKGPENGPENGPEKGMLC